jgi:hypothetical protein
VVGRDTMPSARCKRCGCFLPALSSIALAAKTIAAPPEGSAPSAAVPYRCTHTHAHTKRRRLTRGAACAGSNSHSRRGSTPFARVARGPSSGLGPRPCLDEPAHEARGLLLAHARPRGLPRRHQGRRSPTARAVLPAPRRRRRGGGPRSGPERVRERPQRASWPRERPFVGRDSERRRNTSLARAVRGEKKRGHGGSWPRARACSGGGGGGGGWLARGSSGVGGGCSGEARRSCGRLALPGEEAGPLGGERGEDGGGLGQHGRRRVECGEDLGSEGGGRGAGARGARREGGAHRGHQRRRPTAPLLGRLQPCVGAARSEAARALRVCQAARERGSPLLQRLHDRPRLSHLVQQHRRTYYTFGAAGKQPAPSARLIVSALQNSLHSPHLDPPRRSVR